MSGSITDDSLKPMEPAKVYVTSYQPATAYACSDPVCGHLLSEHDSNNWDGYVDYYFAQCNHPGCECKMASIPNLTEAM